MTATCHVMIWNPRATGQQFSRSHHRCGLPVVAGRLCAAHEADRVRLGGAR